MKKLLILFLLSISLSASADSHLDFTLSDFCAGQPGVQYREGVYYFPNEDIGITATSICVYKDAYGQYSSKGKLKNGKRHGHWDLWYENGQKKAEVNYINGTIDGELVGWHENGQKSMELGFISSSDDISVNSWHENGQQKSNGTVYISEEGKVVENGLFTFWFDNGQKEKEGIYSYQLIL